MVYDRCCMRKYDNNHRYLNKLIISSNVTSVMRLNSFQAELLACPQVLFSSKSLSLPLILILIKNSVIFPSFAFFLCIISFAMSIMFVLLFVGFTNPSIDFNQKRNLFISLCAMWFLPWLKCLHCM